MLRRPKVARVASQIDQRDLEHAFGRDPEIGLPEMVVEGLDRAGVTEGGRDLGLLRVEGGDRSLAEAGHFEKVAAVVGPEAKRGSLDAGDKVGRVGSQDDVTDALVAAGHFEGQRVIRLRDRTR